MTKKSGVCLATDAVNLHEGEEGEKPGWLGLWGAV